MKAAGIPINRGMALAPARVVPPWPVFSDEKREFHTPKERQIASVQNAVSSLSAFYTESANNFYAIGDNTRGDIMVVHNAILHDHSLQEENIRANPRGLCFGISGFTRFSNLFRHSFPN